MSATSARAVSMMTGSTGLARRMLREDLDPAAAGKHHVKDDEVRVALERAALAVGAVGRDLDVVALPAQGALHEVGDPALVLDQKDPHRAIVRTGPRSPVRELSRDP